MFNNSKRVVRGVCCVIRKMIEVIITTIISDDKLCSVVKIVVYKNGRLVAPIWGCQKHSQKNLANKYYHTFQLFSITLAIKTFRFQFGICELDTHFFVPIITYIPLQ